MSSACHAREKKHTAGGWINPNRGSCAMQQKELAAFADRFDTSVKEYPRQVLHTSVNYPADRGPRDTIAKPRISVLIRLHDGDNVRFPGYARPRIRFGERVGEFEGQSSVPGPLVAPISARSPDDRGSNKRGPSTLKYACITYSFACYSTYALGSQGEVPRSILLASKHFSRLTPSLQLLYPILQRWQ